MLRRGQTTTFPERLDITEQAAAGQSDPEIREVPVLLVPCIQGCVEGLPTMEQASMWGSILPAIWSFMLTARAHGLGTSWTTVHLYYEQETAEVLGIPYEKVTQAALIPVAYTLGMDFKPAPRASLESVLHWERW